MPPTMLIDTLESVRRRVKLLGVTFGAGVVLAAAVGALLLTVFLDYLLNLPPGPRFVLIVASIGGIGYALWYWVMKPLMARLSLGDVAGKLESAFPQFDDRLRSTVNFLRGDEHGHAPDTAGSDVMKQRVISQTTSLASQLDLNRAIVMRPVWYSLAAGVGAILLAVILAAAVGQQYRNIALSRLLTPFAGDPWPKRVQIDLVDTVPARVPVGQRVDLKMRLARGDRASTKATVYYRYGNSGAWQQELMTRGTDGTYTASLDARVADANAATGSLQVRLAAGDDSMELPQIAILPRLAVTRVVATVTPPQYVLDSGGQPAEINLAQQPALMAVGSQVALKLAFNKPLDPAQPIVLQPVSEEMKAPPVQWKADADGSVVGTWAATDTLRFHVKATDTDGFRNPGIEEYELIVRPDQQPLVQIEEPRRNEERTAVATVPLTAVAEDDYGVQALKLHVERLGDRKQWDIDLLTDGKPLSGTTWNRVDGTGDRQRFRAGYQWELSQLAGADLKPGDVLEYHLLVQDNFNLNGATHAPAQSGKLRIHVISQEQFTDAITLELREDARLIDQVRRGEVATRDETQALAEETQAKPELDPADRAAAERLANQQSTAASQAKQIAARLKQVQERMDQNKSPATDLKELAADVERTLNKAAEQPMKEAASRLGGAQQPKPAAERNKDLEAAVEKQNEATAELDKALNRMSAIGSLQDTITKFERLLDEQRQASKATKEVGKTNLGKTPQQMSAEDRKRLEDAAKKQADLAKKTDAALAEMKKMAGQMEKSDPAASKAMEQAGQTAQQQQVAPNQRKASEQAKQNQQQGAQQAQKQAELGLEMMIGQLKEAERRKLEELNRKLADLQKQIAGLIRRQAGHNVDNLMIQGPDRLAKLTAEDRDALLAKAQRDKNAAAAPAPQLPALSQGQEQTERNTRGIAKAAEDVPNAGEAVSQLVRAAGRMERANISLRGKKLEEAYAPPQQEALAALEAAKQAVDEQKREAQRKEDERKKETIRQAYVEIKEAQDAINSETTRIDATRGPDAQLIREEIIKLGQQPGVQGALAERTKKLEEALSGLGSVVYVWANNDIVSSMNQVKDDLGKQQTGVPTRAEQARIVEQLDAMIRNLATKPPENEQFAERDSGGGGGGQQGQGAPRLPTEAELQLMRDLQQALNGSTKKVDAEPKQNPERNPRLLQLGNRQGDLRGLLDQLLQQASQGQVKLGPEPDPKDQLPEEAGAEAVANQELDRELLDGAPDAEEIEKSTNLIGDRMARSRQRLAINNDPGKTTQLIQERILIDLDQLMEQARQQQQQQQQQQAAGQGQPMDQRPEGAQADNQGEPQPEPQETQQAEAAQKEAAGEGGNSNAELSRLIEESAREWGDISPRARKAVIEGASDKPIEKYKTLIDDYYRGMATRGSER